MGRLGGCQNFETRHSRPSILGHLFPNLNLLICKSPILFRHYLTCKTSGAPWSLTDYEPMIGKFQSSEAETLGGTNR